MKKTWIIALAVVALAAIGIGIAVPALAHSANNAAPAVSAEASYLGGPVLTRVADVLGLTTDELTSRLQNGETLAGIAAAQGIDEGAVIDAIVAPFADQLAVRVKYGYLTQAEADQALAQMRERASAMINEDFSAYGDADSWEEMEEYCEDMMGSYGGEWGGMMNGFGGHGMMGGWNGGGGFGGMMGGWNGGNGFGGMMGGWSDQGSTGAYRNGAGFGGMMGGRGSGGGMMGW